MAIANYEAVNKLLREGDYNVRVTIGHHDNQTDSAFLELIRDSLGGGIINSRNEFRFVVNAVRFEAVFSGGIFDVKGNEFIANLKENIHDYVAVRIDIIKQRRIKTWIIVR